MTSGLELAKLVSTSFLYRYWKDLAKAFKAYMTTGVVILMMITSAGIYGFLSSAYSSTADKLNQVDGQVELFEKKKENMQDEASRIKSIMDNKSNRVNALTSLRTSQESRIDTLYKKGFITSARKTEVIIKEANTEIEKANHQIDSLNAKMQSVLDSAGRIDVRILELKSSDIKGEVGPLKYISALTGKDMGSVVNFFILLLIFVCDPLAVCLIIATNKVLMESEVNKDIKKESIVEPELKNETIVSVSDLKIEAPEIKKENFVKYVEDENGGFKETTQEPKPEVKIEEVPPTVDEDTSPKVNEQEKTKYLEFLGILFKGGLIDKDGPIPYYKEFLTSLRDKGMEVDENEIKDFLTLCIMLKIISIGRYDSHIQGKAIKDYSQAQSIIRML
jgi:hypothetical protein